MNNKGFILISITFILLLIGVTSVALNRKAGLQSKMAENHRQAVQTAMGQNAAVEQAMWKLTEDPLWWTDSAGKDYTYAGVDYTRTVQASSVSGYTDAKTISVQAPGAAYPIRMSARYYVHPPISSSVIDEESIQICMDNSDNIYFALRDEHSIYRLDAGTGAITMVAGNGTSGDSGDDGPATDAQLNRPRGVSIDTFGNLYIADSDNHRIKKVTAATGIIDTIAGTGVAGYTGDGAAATSATLRFPRMLYVQGSNVFIADTDNNVIRRIDGLTLKIDTVAGDGTAGNSGDDAKATNAQLDHPWGIWVEPSGDDTGDFYIADRENDRIRMVRYSDNKFIYAVAGIGTAGYTGNGALAVNAELRKPNGVFKSGNDVYIADTDNHVIRKVDGATLNIATIAGTGSAGYSGDGGLPTSAMMNRPFGLFMDSSGNLIFADSNNTVLRKVVEGSTISSLYSSGGLSLTGQRHIALDTDGNLYIADTDNHRIRKLTPAGGITTVAGTGSPGYSGDGGAATSAELNKPRGIAVDSSGNIYIADTDNHCIRKIDESTGDISRIAGQCGTSGYLGDGSSAKDAAWLDKPHAVDIDGSGNIYVADTNNCWIRKFTEGGNIVRVAGVDSGGPSCGNTVTATALTTQLNNPEGVHIYTNLYDAVYCYIADKDNHKVWMVDPSGNITAVAGTGTAGYSGDGGLAVNAQLNKPKGMHVDSYVNLYIADGDNDVMRVVSMHNDFIYTLAGTGVAGYNGDDLSASLTQFDEPVSIVMGTPFGGKRIYISDKGNNRIRVLEYEIEALLN